MNSRSLATRRVMKAIARRSQETPLPVRASDGTLPVVVCLPEDRLVDMARNVSKNFAGAANVFVTLRDEIALIDFSIDTDDPEAAVVQQGHVNTSMQMYVEFLKLRPGQPSKMTVSFGGAKSSDVQSIAYAF